MTNQATGLLLGGLAPAILYGVVAVLQKTCSQAGISTGVYLILIGLATAAVGAVWHACAGETLVTWKSAGYAVLIGVLWSVAMGLVVLVLTRYTIPLSKLVPLYNMNTLVAVVLGMVLLGEWRHASVWQLLLAALLVVIGGTLAARA